MVATALRSRPVVAQVDDDLRRLAVRAPRLALLVEAGAVRSDVRRVRSRLLLLLLELACPLKGHPRRPWYVPGAVARLDVDGLVRAWTERWEEVPCTRTVRRHLIALEDCLAVVRQPGDRIPSLRRPGRAPRFPDTIHVLEDEVLGAWWERHGVEALRRHPEARTSPEAWERILGPWKAWARSRQLELPFGQAGGAVVPMPGQEPVPSSPVEARAAARLLARSLRGEPWALLEGLHAAGVHVPVRRQLEALARPAGLRRAVALYALALARGDRIRSGWGWVRAAWARATEEEGRAALRRLAVEDVEITPAPRAPDRPPGRRRTRVVPEARPREGLPAGLRPGRGDAGRVLPGGRP